MLRAGRGRSRWQGERGSQVVEFALIVPFLMYLVLSVPVFGFAMRSWLVVTMAARDAAREYAVNEKQIGKDLAVAAAFRIVGNQIQGQGLHPNLMQVINIKPDAPIPGHVTVTLTYNQPAMLPGLAWLLDPTAPSRDAFRIVAQSTFRVER